MTDLSGAVWRKSSRSASTGGQCVEVALNLVGVDWRKSSRSGSTGGDCVEVALNLVGADWHKSSRSGSTGGECVEVARNLTGIVAVRDSKDPAGPALVVNPAMWSEFTSALRTDNP